MDNKIFANDLLELFLQQGMSLVKVMGEDGVEFTFIPDDFRPYNPTQHQHSTDIKGKDVTQLLANYAVSGSIDYNQKLKTIQTKLEEIPSRTYIFSREFKYIWIKS